MKKTIIGAALLALALTLTGCGAQAAAEPHVAPYEMNESQEEMLSLLGLKDNARLFTYYCPEGALAVTASTYVLENGAWVSTGQGTIFWEEQEEENAQGVFSLLVREDRSFVLSLHGMGTSTFQSDPVTPPEEPLAVRPGLAGGGTGNPAGRGNSRGVFCGGQRNVHALLHGGGLLHPRELSGNGHGPGRHVDFLSAALAMARKKDIQVFWMSFFPLAQNFTERPFPEPAGCLR